jgi:hypothetical protein
MQLDALSFQRVKLHHAWQTPWAHQDIGENAAPPPIGDPMRALFSIVSLLIVLAIVGVLAKKQLGGTASVAPGATPGASPQQQSQQIQQQIKQTVEGTLQQARPMPEDAPK